MLVQTKYDFCRYFVRFVHTPVALSLRSFLITFISLTHYYKRGAEYVKTG